MVFRLLLAAMEVIWIGTFGVLWVKARRNTRRPRLFRDGFMLPFRYAGDQICRRGWPPYVFYRLRQTMTGLYGDRQCAERMQRMLSQMIALLFASGLAANTIALAAGGDGMTAAALWGCALLMPCFPFREAERAWRKKQLAIRLELPVVLNKLLLQIEAGETMQRALMSAAVTGKHEHALYAELLRVKQRIEQQAPLTAALEEMSRRCPLKEVRLFVNALSLNVRRGGDQLTLTLRELSARLWAERQAAARILGEEASSKLLFPMVLLFLVVMVIVASPAILLMG
jgi:tight adherence protein C